MDTKFSSWFTEQVDEREMHLFLKSDKSVSFNTDFQHIETHELAAHGKTIVIDGAVQSAERDEYLFHEALVHPAMLSHPEPKKVLILGGGEGATLREVLKHPSVESVTMVDIDEKFVDYCKLNLIQWHRGSFFDKKVTLLCQDGRAFLKNNPSNIYDVIIIDITDILEDGPAIALYTKEFYKLCKERMSDNGMLAIQSLVLSPSEWAHHATVARTVRTSFKYVNSYNLFVPSFISTWGFLIASNFTDASKISNLEIHHKILERDLANKLKAYDEYTHVGMFQLTKDLRMNLAKSGSILEDGKPLIFEPSDRI